MTPGAVALGIESPLAIMTYTTKLAGVDLFHGDLDSALLHLWEHPAVMTFLAFDAGFLVYGAVESHTAHRAFVELDGFLCRDGQDNSGADKQNCNNQYAQFLHNSFLLAGMVG